METIEIKITGSGTAEKVAEALRSLASDIASGEHNSSIELLGKCEWEDATLFTEIKVIDGLEDDMESL